MAVDCHFQIQPGELGQVPVRIRVLRAEDGSDLKDTLHICRDAHLLRELRTLGEVRGAAEVVDLEDGRAGLGRRSLEFRRVDLDEPSLSEERAKELA